MSIPTGSEYYVWRCDHCNETFQFSDKRTYKFRIKMHLQKKHKLRQGAPNVNMFDFDPKTNESKMLENLMKLATSEPMAIFRSENKA